jgi:hypothetical protein
MTPALNLERRPRGSTGRRLPAGGRTPGAQQWTDRT